MKSNVQSMLLGDECRMQNKKKDFFEEAHDKFS